MLNLFILAAITFDRFETIEIVHANQAKLLIEVEVEVQSIKEKEYLNDEAIGSIFLYFWFGVVRS